MSDAELNAYSRNLTRDVNWEFVLEEEIDGLLRNFTLSFVKCSESSRCGRDGE